MAVALALLVAASQEQWWIWRAAQVTSWTPRQLEWLLAGVALFVLVACRRVGAAFPVPEPPRPRYEVRDQVGITGWAFVARVVLVPVVVLLLRALDVPYRDPEPAEGGVAELFLDGVVAAALWEELLWRVAALGLLLRVTGPQLAVVLQAVSFPSRRRR